jgi:hypothetical protein
LEQIGVAPNVDKRVTGEVAEIESDIFIAWKVHGRSLREWIDTPPFNVRSVSLVGSAKDSLVRVEFEKMSWHPLSKNYLGKGYFVFDPRDHWVIREFEMQITDSHSESDGYAQHLNLEYGQSQDGFPILTKKLVVGTDPRGKMGDELTTLYPEMHHEIVSPDEFRLSYFGLPEPNFSWSGRKSMWLYVSTGILCLFVACVMWRRRARAASGH